MEGVDDDFDVDVEVDRRTVWVHRAPMPTDDRVNLQHVIEVVAQPRWDPAYPRVDVAAHPAGAELVQARRHLRQVRRLLTGAHDGSAEPWPADDRVLGLLAAALTEMDGLLGCWFIADPPGRAGGHLDSAARHHLGGQFAERAETDWQANELLAAVSAAETALWEAATSMSHHRKRRARKPDPLLQALLVAEVLRGMVGVIHIAEHQYTLPGRWFDAAAELVRDHRTVMAPVWDRTDRPPEPR